MDNLTFCDQKIEPQNPLISHSRRGNFGIITISDEFINGKDRIFIILPNSEEILVRVN